MRSEADTAHDDHDDDDHANEVRNQDNKSQEEKIGSFRHTHNPFGISRELDSRMKQDECDFRSPFHDHSNISRKRDVVLTAIPALNLIHIAFSMFAYDFVIPALGVTADLTLDGKYY